MPDNDALGLSGPKLGPAPGGLSQRRGRKRTASPDSLIRTDRVADKGSSLRESGRGRKRTRVEINGLTADTRLRSASQEGRVRSNSVDRNGLQLRNVGRKKARAEDTALAPADMKDFSSIAVYSREAFENFGKTWRTRMNSDSLERATKLSRKGVSPEDISTALGRQSRSDISTGFNDQVQALLENKIIPHVIAVIEGKEEQSSLTLGARLEDKPINLSYTRAGYFQGLSTTGSNDNKQSMSIYVRDDMKNVYSFTKELVAHSEDVITSVGVNYSTTDGTKYRSLIVHIPNKFIGSTAKELATHQAFEQYAKDAPKVTPGVVVTGYLGDTNFKNPMFKDTVPSMGGHLPNGNTLSPQSSGAKHDTNFMQSIPVGNDQNGHSVLQPATLNSVFLSTDNLNREATDHPSMMHITAHQDEISGRDQNANPDYYMPIKVLD